MTERELLIDCLGRLNEADLAYMVTGSMASNFWGIPRSTHDLDFAIQLPPAAVPRIIAAFANDFHIDEQAVRAAYRSPFQFNAIHRGSSFKVDFWLPANTPFEREMFRRRSKQTVFGTEAWIATPEDIILHKLYWNQLTPSDRQLDDTAGVFAVQHENIDQNYLRQWAAKLGVTETLNLLLERKLRPKKT
ncbi:MAG TPA: hypothetical protein VH598_07760 [Verrucomicrobiae bacterium]|nr:hypothetical protein [Verrucomicrobiae bacterium]